MTTIFVALACIAYAGTVHGSVLIMERGWFLRFFATFIGGCAITLFWVGCAIAGWPW